MRISTLRSLFIASSCLGIVSSCFAQDDDPLLRRTPSVDPSAISSKVPLDKLILSIGQYYGSYSGRSIEMKEGLVGFAPFDWVYAWYAKQEFLAKGRTSTSRLDLSSDSYGIRFVLKRAVLDDDPTLAIQVEATRPGDANQRSGNSKQVFKPTRNNSFSVLYGLNRRIVGRAGYSTVEGNQNGKADVFDLGIATEIPCIGNLNAHAQAEIIAQTWQGANLGPMHRLEIKPMFNVGVGYKLCRWASLQADFAVMTSGVPLAGGRFGALGSYKIYEPGGVAGELRKSLVGYGALRLVAGGSF